MGQLLHHKNGLKNQRRKNMASSFYALERMVKGFANHRRIEILSLLQSTPEQSVEEITEKLKVNFRTTSVHIQRLAAAGLVLKRNAGQAVRHKITDRGIKVLTFLRTLE